MPTACYRQHHTEKGNTGTHVDELLVGLRHISVGETFVVAKIKLCCDQAVIADLLHVGLQVHGLVRLDSEHELVPVSSLVVRKRIFLKLNANFTLALVHSLATLHDKGHPSPSLVVNAHRRHRVRLSLGVVRHIGIERVALILPKDNVVKRERAHRAKHLHLFVTHCAVCTGKEQTSAQRSHIIASFRYMVRWTRRKMLSRHALTILRVERRWCLHSNESYELKEMVLHHIANETNSVEVSSATLDSNVFLEGDGDRRDVLAVPDDDSHHIQTNDNQSGKFKKRCITSAEHSAPPISN